MRAAVLVGQMPSDDSERRTVSPVAGSLTTRVSVVRLRLDVPLVELPYYLYRNVHTGLKGITIIQNNEQCSDYQMEFTVDELLGLNRTGFKVEVVG